MKGSRPYHCSMVIDKFTPIFTENDDGFDEAQTVVVYRNVLWPYILLGKVDNDRRQENLVVIAAASFVAGCFFFVVDALLYMVEAGDIGMHPSLYFLGSLLFLAGSIAWFLDS